MQPQIGVLLMLHLLRQGVTKVWEAAGRNSGPGGEVTMPSVIPEVGGQRVGGKPEGTSQPDDPGGVGG